MGEIYIPSKCMPELTIHIGEPGQSNFSTVNIEWFDKGRKQVTPVEIEIHGSGPRTLRLRVNNQELWAIHPTGEINV